MDKPDIAALPNYAALKKRTDAPPGSSWRLFGKDDQLGTLNFISRDARKEGARAVKTGDAYSLDLRSDALAASLAPTRKPVCQHIFKRNEFHRDEWLDSLYTQYGSQIDGLRHIGHPDYGFYNGFDPNDFEPGTETLGIHHFSDVGIASRGVLIDIERYLASQGESIDHTTGQAIPIEAVTAAQIAQGVEIQPGDIVLLRFGWLKHYRDVATPEFREGLVDHQFHPGLKQSEDTVAWLWDNRISLIAADNFALECWPARDDSPFYTARERETGARGVHSGIMHRAIIPLLGMPIGELWDLDALAEACAKDKRYTFLLTLSPLSIVGGVGSPANAVAIR